MKQCAILIAMFIAVLLTGCDRFSYREDYIGNFAVETRRTIRDAAVPDTTVTNYDGAVRLYGPDQIVLRFLQDDSLATKLEKDGQFTIENLTTGSTFTGGYSDLDHWEFESTFASFTGDLIWLGVKGSR